MKTKTGLIALFAVVIFSVLGISSVFAGGKADIGISLPTQREERWVLDKKGFEKAAKAAGVKIAIQIADNDAARQQAQCENLIAQGVKVLIVAPHDENAAKNIVDMARTAKIPVISYDRLIGNANVDLYVTFDQFRIGFLMGEYMAKNLNKGNIVFLKGDPGDSTCKDLRDGAMSAIQAKVDSGDYKIVLEQDCRDWEPREALKHMESALTLTGNDVQGVIAPNDGTAGGVIQALAAQGLDGKVIVTGQDCETDAIKRIIAGTQSMTVFFDCGEMAEAALQAAAKIVQGQNAKSLQGVRGTENDGSFDVPVLQFPAVQVTKDNYRKLLIDTKIMNEKDLR
jgi:D-xylose transport system substrate-binding protein